MIKNKILLILSFICISLSLHASQPPIITAVKNNDLLKVQQILTENPDSIKDKDSMKLTALHTAVEKKNHTMIKALIPFSAKNERDYFGRTPLHIAAKECDSETIKTLIHEGEADKEATDNGGNTPLHKAASSKNNETLKALITEGANVNATNDTGETPLYLAAKFGNGDTINELLLAKADIETTTSEYENTPLLFAAQCHNLDTAMTLLANGANAKAKSKGEETPLHRAALFMFDFKAKAPLIKEAYAETKKHKDPALPLAAEVENNDFTKALLAKGADINATNTVGMTPLHFAAEEGNVTFVKTMIANGANLNITTKHYKETPLHRAVLKYRSEITKLLISSGANPNIPNTWGRIPLQVAIGDATLEDAWDEALRRDDENKMKSILIFNPDFINKPFSADDDQTLLLEDDGDRTLLHKAIRTNKSSLLKALLSCGADPNIPDAAGKTALYWAVNKERSEMIKKLIQHGALNSPDNNGQRPIDITNSPAIKNLIIEQLISAHRQQSLFKANLKKLYEIYQHGDPTPLVQVLGGTTPIRQLTEIPQTTTQGARNFFNDLGILDPIINELNKLPGFAVPQNR